MNRFLISIGLVALIGIAHAAQHPAACPPHWWTPAAKEGAPGWEILQRLQP